MALSNWDTLAFDSEGNPGDGSLTIPSGASVAIYKNWLHVSHPNMWHDSSEFSKNIIAQIHCGEIDLADFEIKAVRHDEQDSIFCYVKHTEWRGKDESSKDYHMAGIGCYGFKDELEWLKEKYPEIYNGIDPKWLDEEKCLRSSYHSFNGKDKEEAWGFDFHMDVTDYDPNRDHFKLPLTIKHPDLDDLWMGVSENTAKAFYKWLKEVAPLYFATIKPENGMRFNQGDAFFAANSDIPLNATPVGESKGTVIAELLQNIEEN